MFFAAVLAAGSCAAQQDASSAAAGGNAPLGAVLGKLGAEAARLHDAMPNFECTETADSTVTRDGKTRKRVTFTATITARRDAEGKLQESFRVLLLDGKPYGKGTVKVPYYIRGGFSGALNYVSLAKQPCYVYSLVPGRLGFAAKADGDPKLGCDADLHQDGFVTLDAAGTVTHMEYRMPLEDASRYRHPTFNSLDLQTVDLNGGNYEVISHMLGEYPSGKDLLRFEASYTGCHYFGSSVKLLPGSTVVSESPAASDTPDPK